MIGWNVACDLKKFYHREVRKNRKTPRNFKNTLILATVLSFALLQPFLAVADDSGLSDDEILFLDLVQQRSFEFFLKESHPKSGLVKDKAGNFSPDSYQISSIAATGFGLSAMIVGAERGWISRETAYEYCRGTLEFVLHEMPHRNGFLPHFVNWETGRPTRQTEYSSIDTALFLAGALHAAGHFPGTEVATLAGELYERVDFPWMLNEGSTLSMGYKDQQGFIKHRWSNYDESSLLYFLAIGSPTHPLDPQAWHKVKKRIGRYGDLVFAYSSPLFTHQYSQIWLDLREKNDGFMDYFENSKLATLAQKAYASDHQSKYKAFSEGLWGLTASLSPDGYKAYGTPPGGEKVDGTIAPTAAASSIVFTPKESIAAMQRMYELYGSKIWGRYGFSDAFNPDRNWYAKDVLGIDQGPILLMIENFRTGLVWKEFSSYPTVAGTFTKIGFQSGTRSVAIPEAPTYEANYKEEGFRVDGNLEDWNGIIPWELEGVKDIETGEIDNRQDAFASMRFAWNDEYLFFSADITDEDLVSRLSEQHIWKDDCIELFIDPELNGLNWGSQEDFQIGFSPGEGNEVKVYAWFQKMDPQKRGLLVAKVIVREGGWALEVKIAWRMLGLRPIPGMVLGLTPTYHDLDSDRSEGKLNPYFIPDGKSGQFTLAKLRLE